MFYTANDALANLYDVTRHPDDTGCTFPPHTCNPDSDMFDDCTGCLRHALHHAANRFADVGISVIPCPDCPNPDCTGTC